MFRFALHTKHGPGVTVGATRPATRNPQPATRIFSKMPSKTWKNAIKNVTKPQTQTWRDGRGLHLVHGHVLERAVLFEINNFSYYVQISMILASMFRKRDQ